MFCRGSSPTDVSMFVWMMLKIKQTLLKKVRRPTEQESPPQNLSHRPGVRCIFFWNSELHSVVLKRKDTNSGSRRWMFLLWLGYKWSTAEFWLFVVHVHAPPLLPRYTWWLFQVHEPMRRLSHVRVEVFSPLIRCKVHPAAVRRTDGRLPSLLCICVVSLYSKR